MPRREYRAGTGRLPGMLIAARFVQGAGGAMASSVTLGMIVRLFTQPDEQGRAIGAFAFTGAVGASAGLIARRPARAVRELALDLLREPARSALLAWIAGWRVLAADQGIGLRAGADVLGALLVTVRRHAGGLRDRRARGTGGPAWSRSRCSPAFAARQATARTPLLPLRVLASRNVSGANLAQLLIIGAAMGFQVIVTLYMQRALGFGPAAAGPRPGPGRRGDRRGVARPVGAADRRGSAPGRCCSPGWS